MSEAPGAMPQAGELERGSMESTEMVATFEERDRTPLQAVQHFLHGNPAMVPLIVLILSVIAFAVIVGARFYSAFALTLILQQVAITGIVATAETIVILTAGIDLSVGAIMVLSSVVMGRFAIHYGAPGWLAVIAGLVIGSLCGFVNGALIAKVKLPPFIVTLGSWSVFGAANFIYSNNETIRAQDVTARAPILQFFGNSIRVHHSVPILGNAVLTYGVILMVLLAGVFWYVLNQTAWGRHVYAVGDDPESAMLAGIRVDRMLIAVYTVTGFICALAGWALIGRIGAVSPQAGQLENINAITAVVIGGTSLFGGRGSILGTLFGALIVGVFSLGLRLWGTDPQWTELTVGALIVVAVAIDQWIRKVSA